MFESSFLLPLFVILHSCLCPESLVSALSQLPCITFFFDNGNVQSPPTSTVFRSISTTTSALPCGSCKLETQAFFPYPFYGYAAIDDGFTATVTSPLSTSTSFICDSSASSGQTRKETTLSGARPTGTIDSPFKLPNTANTRGSIRNTANTRGSIRNTTNTRGSIRNTAYTQGSIRNTANTRGPIVTGTARGLYTASGFRLSSVVDPLKDRNSDRTAILGSITATRVSTRTIPSSIKKNSPSLRPYAPSGLVHAPAKCTNVDPAAPTADCLTLTFTSGNFTSCTSCPTKPADLSLCPFLCSIPLRGGPILQCSPTNLEVNSDITPFGVAGCQKCLPACDVTLVTRRQHYLPSSSLVTRLPSSVVSRLPSSVVSRLPSSVVSRLPSSVVSRLSSSVVSRLPSSLVYRLPSSSRVSYLPSSSLVSRLPSQSLVSRSLSFPSDFRTLINPSTRSLSASNATVTTNTTPPSTGASIGADPTSSCPLIPAVVDQGDPCQIDFSDNLICSACPTLFEVNVFACPFLCQVPFGEGLSALQCSQSDLAGQDLISSYDGIVQSCQKCLTDCPAPTFTFSRPAVTSTTIRSSTSSSIASTCTSIGASATSSPFLLTSDEILYRESCGTAQAEVDACPFLCSGSRAQLFSRCAQSDESGTVFDNLVQLCEPCLPPCEEYRRA